MCIIYCQDVVSYEQKESLLKLFSNISDKANVGIIICNRDTDYYIVNNGNYLNNYEIIDYINNMNMTKKNK